MILNFDSKKICWKSEGQDSNLRSMGAGLDVPAQLIPPLYHWATFGLITYQKNNNKISVAMRVYIVLIRI